MTSSEFQKARGVLETLAQALSPQKMQETIDAPVEAMAEGVLRDLPHPSSCAAFNGLLCKFIRTVYAEASLTKRILSMEEAFAIGLDILGAAYGHSHGEGYENALLDVLSDGSLTMEALLQSVAEGIKERERRSYVRWVYALHVDPLDWVTKCDLADAIRTFHQEETGLPLFENMTSGSLAGHLPELVDLYLETTPAGKKGLQTD